MGDAAGKGIPVLLYSFFQFVVPEILPHVWHKPSAKDSTRDRFIGALRPIDEGRGWGGRMGTFIQGTWSGKFPWLSFFLERYDDKDDQIAAENLDCRVS